MSGSWNNNNYYNSYPYNQHRPNKTPLLPTPQHPRGPSDCYGPPQYSPPPQPNNYYQNPPFSVETTIAAAVAGVVIASGLTRDHFDQPPPGASYSNQWDNCSSSWTRNYSRQPQNNNRQQPVKRPNTGEIQQLSKVYCQK